MTDIETILYLWRWLYRSPKRTQRCWSGRISGVIQRLGLLPANKILAGFRQCLAGFLESDLSLEAHRHLRRLRRLIRKVVHWIRWSVFCSSRRCVVKLEVSHSFTPATMKAGLLPAFLKRSNKEDLNISLVMDSSTQSSYQTGERCANRECIPTCGSSVKTWYADSPFSALRRSPMLTPHTTVERS